MLGIPIGSRFFAPRLVPSLLALPLIAVFLWAGQWQLERAAQKRALTAAYAHASVVAEPLTQAQQVLARYTRVELTGHYRPEHQILLDSMTHAGAVGYRVLTPFECDSGLIVLVDRGWVVGGTRRSDLPTITVTADSRRISGLIDELPRAGLKASTELGTGWPRVLNYPTLGTVQQVLARTPYPKIVLLDVQMPDGFVREWTPAGFPAERHLGYAVQWYALAITLTGLYVFFSLRRRPARGVNS